MLSSSNLAYRHFFVAQLTVTQVLQWINSLTIGPITMVGQGITVSNATLMAQQELSTLIRLGIFNCGPAFGQLGLDAGLLLTSGKASNAIGPNNSTGWAVQLSMPMILT